jgi:ketosteroid isomerase-like protein
MMRAVLLAAGLAIAACTTAPSISGAVLPPALQRVLDDYAAAWEMHDAKALAALFIDDGRTVVPNACPPGPGRATAEKCYASTGGGPLHLRALDHRIDNDIAYIIGEYALDDADKPRGKFTLTLASQGGRWFIVADMDQSYQPPRGPAQP